MKELFLRGLLDPKTKPTDKSFKDLRSAILKTAERMDGSATLKLERNGAVTLSIDRNDVADSIVKTLQALPNVTVSGIVNELDAYVQGLLHKPDAKTTN